MEKIYARLNDSFEVVEYPVLESNIFNRGHTLPSYNPVIDAGIYNPKIHKTRVNRFEYNQETKEVTRYDDVTFYSVEEMQAAQRKLRDKAIDAVYWRYDRFHRETRLGLETTDSIESLDEYVQMLADLPEQDGEWWLIDIQTFELWSA